MPLKIEQGNLFEHALSNCFIVHGCNSKGKMNSGFAATLRSYYPDAYTVYKKTEKEYTLYLGSVSSITCTNGLVIVNAVTQERYGRDPSIVYVDYAAVEKCLTMVAKVAEKKGLPVHLPFIGGGLANGDREKLLEIFKKVFENVDATLWVL